MGAGHAHLHLLRQAPRLRRAGVDVALVAPPTFRYSGTASAVASGDLPPHAGTIDVARLAAEAGVRHLEGRVVAMDRSAKCAETHDGRRLGYDVASFNVGSVPDTRGVTVGEGVVRVKPMEELATLAGRLASLHGAGPVRVGVVGSGASGLEVAGHVACRLAGQVTVVVFERDLVPAGFLPAGARHAALRRLVSLGVTFRVGVTVAEVAADCVVLADGQAVACDLTVLATGLVANPIVQRLGLGDHQGIPVRPTLQHVDDEDVLAAGDCAHFLAAPLPNLGVHGVRQGPVLLEGLLARNAGEPLPAYRPPRITLQVLDLGGGRGLATRGRRWWHGRGAHVLKRIIDRRWLARHPGPAR